MPTEVIPQRGPYTCRITVLLLSCLVIAVTSIVLFCYYQHISSFAALQGYWHVYENIYLLIDNDAIEFIELKADSSQKSIYKDSGASLHYKSIMATMSHRYELQLTNEREYIQDCLKPFNNTKKLTLLLYPVCGALCIMDKTTEVARFIKDNAMSNEYNIVKCPR